LDNKSRKIVEFYLSELLNHVKSVSEHRFAPLEFSITKKIIVSIGQAQEPVRQVESFLNVASLHPVATFLRSNLEKLEKSGYKMSQMITTLENDSERIIQMFQKILETPGSQDQLNNDLQTIGFSLDLPALRKTYIKQEDTPSPSEGTPKDEVKPISVGVKTEPPASPAIKNDSIFSHNTSRAESTHEKTSVTSASPQSSLLEVAPITQSEAFDHVGDMIGFLSRRTKKQPEKAVAQIVQPTEKVDPKENINAVRSVFSTDRLNSAWETLRDNPTRPRFLISMADGLSQLRAEAVTQNAMPLSEATQRIEETLNAIADNNHKPLNPEALAVLHDLIQQVENNNSDLKSLAPAEILRLQQRFTGSFNMEKPEESPVQSSSSNAQLVAENEIAIDRVAIQDDDWNVFAEDVRFNLELAQSALVRLKKATHDTEAIKDLLQVYRALSTNTRLLKINLLHGHCDAVFQIFKQVVYSQSPVVAELITLVTRSTRSIEILVNGQTIQSDEWRWLNDQSVRFSDYKQATTLVTPAKTTEISAVPSEQTKVVAPEVVKTEIKTAKESSKPISDPKSVVAQNTDWLEGFQSVVAKFNDSPIAQHIKAEKVEPNEKDTKDSTLQIKEETRTQSVTPTKTILPGVEEKPKFVAEAVVQNKIEVKPVEEIKKATPDKKTDDRQSTLASPVTDDTKTIEIEVPKALLAMMAAGDADDELNGLRIPSFAERLNTEPKDIITGGRRTVKKKRSELPKEQVKPIPEKASVKEALKTMTVAPPLKTEKVESAVVEGKLMLEESAFDAVDPEILDIFNQEAAEYFKKFDAAFARLKQSLVDDVAIRDLERTSHSLKSSARMLGFERISGLSAAVELITERCVEKEISVDATIVTLLESITTALRLIAARKAADVTQVVQQLFELENSLNASGTFTGAIPGSASLAKHKGIETKAPEKKPEPVIEAVKPAEVSQPAPKENYFSKLGIDDEIVDIFKEEVSTYFKLIGAALSTLRNNMTHRQSMRDIEKAAHSLRSSAKMLGFQKISNLVKPMETVAEKMNEGELRVTSELIDLYETSIERLKQLTAGTDVDVDDVVGKLQSYEQKAPEATDIKPVNDEDVRARIKAELTQEIKLDKVPEKAVTPNEKVISEKKTETKVKAVKKPAKAFDDVPIEKDAILKNLLKSGPQLLDEMFEATQHGV